MRNLAFGTVGKKVENTGRPRSKSEEPSSLCLQCSKEVAQSLSGYCCLALVSIAFAFFVFFSVQIYPDSDVLGSKMSERKSLESSSSKTQHVEIILEFGHKATLKDVPIKASL